MHCIINQLVVKISGVGIISFFSCLFKNKLFASLRGIFVSHHVVQNGEEKKMAKGQILHISLTFIRFDLSR